MCATGTQGVLNMQLITKRKKMQTQIQSFNHLLYFFSVLDGTVDVL